MGVEGAGREDLRQVVTELLARTIGPAQATRLVELALSRLCLDSSTLNAEGALSVLSVLADMPGLVGIVARLAGAELRASGLRAKLQGGTR